MKKERLEIILSTINSKDIATQEELLAELKANGLEVTQATVSRDIKELGLIKISDRNGKYRYSLPKSTASQAARNLHAVIGPSVQWVDHAMNTVVVKCFPGMAQAVCAAFDSMEINGIVGTLAGDDTIFAVCRTEALAAEMVHTLRDIIKL
ncbi:MAG: arginine repressor [Clostridia bacterium]|nr:arginine repressor [Clostridia bacterium]